jgi:ATP phosphoribosyltransferase
MLKIAVQKSGRLLEESLKLLKESGLQIEVEPENLKSKVKNFEAEVLFLRNSDIPKYLESGVVDVAIIGENVLFENEVEVAILEKLGFSKCKLSIATSKDIDYTDLSFLEGKQIATSYPRTLNKFLLENNIRAFTHYISGSVEIAPNIGLADAICDIVSSGNTLSKNGLEERHIILNSEAVFASNIQSFGSKSNLINELAFRIKSVLNGRNNKYILFNIPNEKLDQAAKILPGLKSPTVLPLFEENWSSIHSVIKEDDFWKVLNDLKKCGAEGILVIPIEKMII